MQKAENMNMKLVVSAVQVEQKTEYLTRYLKSFFYNSLTVLVPVDPKDISTHHLILLHCNFSTDE